MWWLNCSFQHSLRYKQGSDVELTVPIGFSEIILDFPFLKQGHPMTVYVDYLFGEVNIVYTRIFYNLRIRWPFHSCTIFEAYLINSPQFFWSLIFHISPPRLSKFFIQKWKLKIFHSKMWWREELEKFSLL